MSLRIKAFLVLVATLFGVLLVLRITSSVYLKTQVQRQEQEFLKSDMQRAISTLEENLSSLDLTLGDYAIWTDTYQFVLGKNPTYLDVNFSPQKFDHLRLNVAMIIRADGKVLYGQGYDLTRMRMALLPSSLIQYLGSGSALLYPNLPEHGVRTILALPDGPLLVVSRPILTSDGRGPAAGSLLMGRFLDEEDLARWKRTTLMDINLYSTISNTPPAAQAMWIALQGAPYEAGGQWLSATNGQMQVIDDQTAAMYAMISGSLHQPMLLEVRAPRTIYQQNVENQRQIFLSAAAMGLLLLVVTFLLLDAAGLKNLVRLNTEVASITERGDLSARVPLLPRWWLFQGRGVDEVNGLAERVNAMLETLEAGQRRRIDDEQRYHAVVEQAFEGVHLADSITLQIIEANPAFQSILGYTLNELREKTLYDISNSPRALIQQDVRGVIENGQAALGERSYRRKDGQVVIVEVSGSLVRFGDRHAICTLVRDVTERKREERAMTLINQISQMAASEMDFRATLQLLVDRLGSLMEADGCYITLWDDAQALVQPVAAFGPLRDSYPESSSSPGELSLTASVMRAGRPLIVQDAYHSPYMSPVIAQEYGVRSLLGLPLVAGEEKIGALLVGYEHSHHFTQEEIARAERVAGPTALAIAKARLFEDLKQSHIRLTEAYDITLEGWARALELRDQETEGHTRRVTVLTLRLGQSMGLSGEALTNLQRGALLHDIGKMGIPDSILLKPGPLTPKEREIINRHPEYAYTMLSPIEYLRPALEIPYRHHERWDGTGYPRQLKGTDIPLSARIFAIVDVWDALTSDRPYRKAWTAERAIDHIISQSGKHFDPAVVEIFLQILPTVYPMPFSVSARMLMMEEGAAD